MDISYAEISKVDLTKFTVAIDCASLTKVTFSIVFEIHLLHEYNEKMYFEMFVVFFIVFHLFNRNTQ